MTSLNEHRTVFHSAIMRNDLDFLKQIHQKFKQLDINTTPKNYGSPVLFATMFNTSEIVKYLVDNGAELNFISPGGNNLVSGLLYAYEHPFDPIRPNDLKEKLDILMAKGLDLSTPLDKGNTFYHYLAKYNKTDFYKMLTDYNIDVNARNNEDLTALQVAANKTDSDVVLKYLISIGADKTIKTDFDETIYDLAIENELLLNNNVDLEFLK